VNCTCTCDCSWELPSAALGTAALLHAVHMSMVLQVPCGELTVC
jgi:hypothetical protein